MIISNAVSIGQQDIEQGDASRHASQTTCCSWTRKT